MKDRCLAVFVLDVLERDRLERLWTRGAAGFLAKLALHGGIRDLVGRDLFSEHGTAWTLFSGVSRAVHGQYDYRLSLPRLDGHPRRRGKAPGVIHENAEEADVHGGVQARGSAALRGR